MSSILVPLRNVKVVKVHSQIISLISSSQQNLEWPKFPKYAKTFDASRHSKSSFVRNHKLHFFHFLFFCDWLLTAQKCQEVFSTTESTVSKPGFSHNYLLDVSLQNLNLMLPAWVRKNDWVIVEISPLCGMLMNQNCPKELLVLTHLDIQTYTTSTLHISFSYQGVNLENFIIEADCSFLKFF